MIRFLAFALCLVSGPAFAHVTANPDFGTAGKYFETAFRVSHGCEGSPTISVSITLPAGMINVKPQYKPGWAVSIRKTKLDKPVPAGHGKTATEQFDTITWSGASLPDDQYDTFGLLMKLPEDDRDILWFPITQICEKGEHKWAEIPLEGQQWHDLKAPAPFVKLYKVQSKAADHQH